MKYFTFLIFIFTLTYANEGKARKDTTIIYCNADLQKVKRKYARYYAKIYKNSDGTIGVQQFVKDGARYLTGSFTDKKFKVKQGIFNYYDYDGIIKKTGRFENNLEEGIWRYVTPSGIVTAEGAFKQGKRIGEWNYYTKEGQKDARRMYASGEFHGEELIWKNDTLISKGIYVMGKKDGYWQRWYESGVKNYEGHYDKDQKTGEWKFYFKSGNIAAIELYAEDEPIKVEWFDDNGNSIEPNDPLEVDPEFPGGIEALFDYISENVNYPDAAIDNGEQGIVFVSFYVELDGSITEVGIIKGVSELLDRESIRLIRKMPKWTPGMHHGRILRTKFTLPIHYRLS